MDRNLIESSKRCLNIWEVFFRFLAHSYTLKSIEKLDRNDILATSRTVRTKATSAPNACTTAIGQPRCTGTRASFSHGKKSVNRRRRADGERTRSRAEWPEFSAGVRFSCPLLLSHSKVAVGSRRWTSQKHSKNLFERTSQTPESDEAAKWIPGLDMFNQSFAARFQGRAVG